MKFVDKNNNIKKLQKYELQILKYFDEFCKKNNIQYFITYGTLLGAVRHKGFIPWDDDIDIFLKGEDYIKLISLYDKLDKKYFLQDFITEPNYYLLWDKIRFNNTTFVEKGWEDNKINNGIFIDLFPLIEIPNNKFKAKIISIKFKLLHIFSELNLNNNKWYNEYGLFGKILFKIFKYIPKKIRNNFLVKSIKKLCLYKTKNSKYTSFDMPFNFRLDKEYFRDTVYLPFEDIILPCPIGYKNILEKIYGDYMELPPKEERIGHGEVYLNFGDDDTEK